MPLYSPATTDTGTTILDGSGIPSSALGADRNYYVDASGQDLYGPKSAIGYGSAEFISAAPTPPPDNSVGSGPFRLGTEYELQVGGQIVGARFWWNNASSASGRQIYLYDGAGTLLGTTIASGAATVEGWIELTFPTPIIIPAGVHRVVVAFDEPYTLQHYGFACPVVNSSHATYIQGRYGTSGGGFPGSVQVNVTRYADLIWRIEGSGDAWPSAVPGFPEAPADGIIYGRKDTAWEEVVSGGGGGTTILNGIGPPAPTLGAVGNYYVDVTGGDLYGPKIDVSAADYVEPSWDTYAGAAYELGGKFRFDIAGYVTGVRYYFPNVTPGLGQILSLWDMTGSTLLASQAATLPTQNAWNIINFGSPVAVLASHSYLVSIWTDGPGFSYPSSYTGPIVSGHVRALAVGEDGSAAYYNSSQAFPTTTWTSFPPLSPMFTLGAAWTKVITGV